MLEVKNISKRFGNIQAVDGVSFEANTGKILGIIGKNGAGKSTIFRIILDILEPDDGEVLLDGKKYNILSSNKVGFLPEEGSLNSELTVYEQMCFYGSLRGMTEDEVAEELFKWLGEFGIVDYFNRKIKELSKGNRQRLQFIVSVLHNPEVIILDEPFSGLDPINVELFKSVILDMSKNGSMIIFSSHRMEHVELFCKKLAIMVKGKTVISGDLANIKKQYRKKNIVIKGDIDTKKLEKIDGVVSIELKNDEYEVKIESSDIVSKVFDEVSKCKNITKFVVEEPSLNEIFISKVGESYE